MLVDIFLVGEDENAKVFHFLEELETQLPSNLLSHKPCLGEIKFVHGEEVKQILSEHEKQLKIMFEVLFTKCP